MSPGDPRRARVRARVSGESHLPGCRSSLSSQTSVAARDENGAYEEIDCRNKVQNHGSLAPCWGVQSTDCFYPSAKTPIDP
jgi:hypothetical protein